MARATLTYQELEGFSAEDFLHIKLSVEEMDLVRQINADRKLENKERVARLKVEEKPLLSELAAVGFQVDSVWDLGSTFKTYPEAISILLKHLALPYSDRIREGIARSLAVPDPEVREAWSFLVNQYRIAPKGRGVVAVGDRKEYKLGAKDALALVLRTIVSEKTMEEFLGLAKDPLMGESRILLLGALKKSKDSRVKEAVECLALDPVLAKEIASWTKKKN